jgi:hypothetical protein
MQIIFVFKKLSLLSLFFLLVTKKSRWRVLVTSCEKSFFVKKIQNLRLIAKDILYMDFTINQIEPNVLNGDYRGYVKGHINQLFEDEYLIGLMVKYFSNNKNIIHKCKIYLNHYFSPFSLQNKIIYWLEQSQYKDATIINFTSMRPGEKFFWKRSNFRVFNIFCYSRFIISLLFSAMKRILAFSMAYLKNVFNKNFILHSSADNNQISNHNHEVLFFPHHNFIRKEADNPPRDYFYSKDINSRFHPTKILHLFLDSRRDSNQDTQYIKEYLGVDDFEYRLLSTRYSLLDLYRIVKFSFKLLFKVKWIERWRLSNQITLVFPLITMYILFESYKKSMNRYKDASIALIGYDMLWPSTLALALEHYKIKTVAVQERFISSFLNAWPYILDVQLTISDLTSSYLKSNNISSIGELIPVGFVRSDHFFDKVKQVESLRVIVLDYHVEIDDECQQKFWPVVNWVNDIRFREEILDLAEIYSNVEFIFRGKDCNWLESEFHQKVIDRVSSLKNVSVDTEYNEKFRSYHLCAGADLIIANPTSLAEECASAGMNVIVVDYGINYTHNVSRWLPESMQDYYCHSFEELKEMFASFINNNFVISQNKRDKIKSDVFSNLTDGNVSERVQDNLKLIYEDINLNTNNLNN